MTNNDDQKASVGKAAGNVKRQAPGAHQNPVVNNETDDTPSEHHSATNLRSNATLDKEDESGKPENVKTGKDGSRVLSVGSKSSSTTAEHRFAREISETFTWKLREMKWCFLALASNIALLLTIQIFTTGEGAVLAIGTDVANTWEGIVMEILLLLTNIFTIMGMDAGVSAFFGYQLATRGRSMAVVGFSQASAMFKTSFANDLSLNSSVRKILNRLSFLWTIMEILKLTTPVGASSLASTPVRSDAFTVDCIAFGQDGRPVDRMWPNVDAEIGFAELIFGKSVGRLRSEEDVTITEAIIGPQVCHCGVCVCRAHSDLSCLSISLLIMMIYLTPSPP